MKFNLSVNTNSTNYLKAWTINEVEFKGIESKEGQRKDGGTWKAFQLHFAGKAGIFDNMFFCPSNGDRRKAPWNPDIELPSDLEELMFQVAHILSVLNPEALQKLQGKLELDLPNDWDKLVTILTKALTPAIGKTVWIKLVGNSRGYATVPQIVSLSREGNEAYMSNSWIADSKDGLSWKNNEMNKMQKAEQTKPTVMPDEPASDDDLNLDDL